MSRNGGSWNGERTRRAVLTDLSSSALVTIIPSTATWRDLPPLPVAVAGPFAGVVGDRLVVAGGSYFDTPPWAGGLKKRTSAIYALRRGEKAWRLAGELPEAVASGASASVAGTLYCVGGQTDLGNSARCLRLIEDGDRVVVEESARLPVALSMHVAVANKRNIYVAGGQTSATATTATRSFYRLSVTPGASWLALPDLPSPGRILPVLAARSDMVYIVGGAELSGEAGPPPGRRFLRDTWRFTDRGHFKRLADAPQSMQAAPSVCVGGRILTFGGNDGTNAAREYVLKDRHPGFSRTVFAYTTARDEWASIGDLPLGLVTTPGVCWEEQFVIPGGEDRPAHRSTRVLAASWTSLEQAGTTKP